MGVTFKDNSQQVITECRQHLANRVNAALEFMVEEAQSNANIDSGFMHGHIGVTVPATENSLSGEMRSLAPYSLFQDIGRHGNLFFTRAFLATREKFKELIMSNDVGTAGRGVVRAAMQEFHHNVTSLGLRMTKIKAFGGGRVLRGKGGKFAGSYGGKK